MQMTLTRVAKEVCSSSSMLEWRINTALQSAIMIEWGVSSWIVMTALLRGGLTTFLLLMATRHDFFFPLGQDHVLKDGVWRSLFLGRERLESHFPQIVKVEWNALIPLTAQWMPWHCSAQPAASVPKISFPGHIESCWQMQAFLSALQPGSMQGSWKLCSGSMTLSSSLSSSDNWAEALW